MAIVKNNHDGTLSFKDDDKKIHELKPGEEVECNYKRSMDPRLEIIIKKKRGGKDGSD
jgi:hypothetical protein